MIDFDKLNALDRVFEENSSFLLICHEDPDGDAIGALLSLEEYLLSLDKKVFLASKSNIPEIFSFLRPFGRIKNDFLIGDHDVIILLDNGDLKRTGFADRIGKAKKKGVPLINIDHHPANDIWKIATINISGSEFSSTCEILFQIFQNKKKKISRTIATNLLTGIYYDTGGFQHKNTTPSVLKISSALMHAGADLKKISKSISQSKSVVSLKLWGIALKRMKFVEKYGLVYSIISEDDMKNTGATEEEISGLVNLLNSASEAEIALLLYETHDGKIKGSLRTENNSIDVSKLATVFGGGGHKKAAGFSFDGKLLEKENCWEIS